MNTVDNIGRMVPGRWLRKVPYLFCIGLLLCFDANAGQLYALNLLSSRDPEEFERHINVDGFQDRLLFVSRAILDGEGVITTASPSQQGSSVAVSSNAVSGEAGEVDTIALSAAQSVPDNIADNGKHAPSAAGYDELDGYSFSFDDPPKARFRITPNLSFGARFEVEVESEQNFDLDSAKEKDERSLDARLSMVFSYRPSDNLLAYLNIEPTRHIVDDDRNLKENETRLEVKQAFLSYSGLFDGSTIKLGRQRYRDTRQWLYDEELNGIRLFHSFSRVAAEFSASGRSDSDLLNDQDPENVINYDFHGRFAADRDNEIQMYVLAQDDREVTNEDRLYIGLHASGNAADMLKYWLELAHLSGGTDDMDLRAYGVDIGATLVFDAWLDPSITLGYAYGSGDDDAADSIDRRFRQTGFQDNEARFNGLIRLKYYGELLDPELSNLQIVSAGFGIRPTRKTSIDLVLHAYRQVEAGADVGDWEIKEDPEGLDDDIGTEVDLVAGYKIKPHHKGELVVGYFEPGDAFSSDADEALYLAVELKYEF